MSEQEPKYDFRDGHVFNRASGEMIPEDEPVMVFRARDIHALAVIEFYRVLLNDQEHQEAVLRRRYDFSNFRRRHPDRMKEPDTDLGASNAHGR